METEIDRLADVAELNRIWHTGPRRVSKWESAGAIGISLALSALYLWGCGYWLVKFWGWVTG